MADEKQVADEPVVLRAVTTSEGKRMTPEKQAGKRRSLLADVFVTSAVSIITAFAVIGVLFLATGDWTEVRRGLSQRPGLAKNVEPSLPDSSREPAGGGNPVGMVEGVRGGPVSRTKGPKIHSDELADLPSVGEVKSAGQARGQVGKSQKGQTHGRIEQKRRTIPLEALRDQSRVQLVDELYSKIRADPNNHMLWEDLAREFNYSHCNFYDACITISWWVRPIGSGEWYDGIGPRFNTANFWSIENLFREANIRDDEWIGGLGDQVVSNPSIAIEIRRKLAHGLYNYALKLDPNNSEWKRKVRETE